MASRSISKNTPRPRAAKGRTAGVAVVEATTAPAVLAGPPRSDEPPGLKEARKRWKKLDKPDGKKAFHAIGDIENPLADIERFVNILYLIAINPDTEDRMQSALYGIANGIDDALTTAEEHREQAWNSTWGFVFGSGSTP